MKLSQIMLSGLLLVSLQAFAMQDQAAGVLDAGAGKLEPIGGNTGSTGDLLPGRDTSADAAAQAANAAADANNAAAVASAAAEEARRGGLPVVGAAAAKAKRTWGETFRNGRAWTYSTLAAGWGILGAGVSMAAPKNWGAGVGGAGVAAAGTTLFAFLDDARVQGLLHKLGESSLEADIDVPTLTTLISYGVWSGNKQAFTLAGWYALGRAVAKLVSSDIATIGLSKLPLIGDQLVSEQDLKRAENGVVPLSEKGAQATKIGIGIAVFVLAQKYLPLVQAIKIPFVGGKQKQS